MFSRIVTSGSNVLLSNKLSLSLLHFILNKFLAMSSVKDKEMFDLIQIELINFDLDLRLNLRFVT